MRKKAVLIFLLRFLRLAIAVLNLSLSAKYFGVNLERDVWLLALSCIIVLDLAIWGPINETFRAKFLFLKEEQGEEQALFKARSLFLFTNVITILLVVLILLFPNVLAKLIAPGYTAKQLVALVLIIKIIAPSFLINQITKLLTAVLNAYSSFFMPEVSGLITQAVTLILILLLAPSIGILTLAISYYFGLGLLLVLLLVEIRKRHIDLFGNIFQVDPWAFKGFVIFSIPFFLPYFAAQFNVMIEKAIASSLSLGAVSIIDYARKFSDIPLEVLAGTVASLLVPVLSAHFTKNNTSAFTKEFKKIYQLGILMITLIVAMLSSCPQAFVNILYKSGNVSVRALNQISIMAMFYGWSMLSVFLYQIFGAALMASNRGKIYAFFGVLAQLVMISINIAFYRSFNMAIFPFSLLISHIIAAVFMFYKIPFSGENIRNSILKYIGIMLAICLIMFAVNHILINIANNFLLIGFNLTIVLALILASLIVFRMEEWVLMKNFLGIKD